MWETWVQSLGWEDPLEKEKVTHSSVLYSVSIPVFFHLCIAWNEIEDTNVHACLVSRPVWLFATPRTVACQAPSIRRISQVRILKCFAMSSSRASSQPRDRIWVSCIGRRVLYRCVTWEAQKTHRHRSLKIKKYNQVENRWTMNEYSVWLTNKYFKNQIWNSL